MMALDASTRDVCRVQRERTSSPLQAFVLLNGPQYVEAARGLAERLITDHGSDMPGSLGEAFRLLTGRQADDREFAVLNQLYHSQMDYFQTDALRIDGFLGIGEAKFDDTIDRPHLAALTVVVSTLMNFDESMMKR
jgi:hypothetical protein